MKSTCLPHTELPQTTRLFCDFIYHFDRVRVFYNHPPGDPQSFRSAAQAVDYPAERRAAVVCLLRRQNGDSPTLEVLARDFTRMFRDWLVRSGRLSRPLIPQG